MLISIVRTKDLMKVIPFVPELQRKHIELNLMAHRGLMVFFFCGYLVVMAAFIFHFSFISNTFVSIIFFLGAVFVFIGVTVQLRLLSEVQSTLKGILPICSRCNKIRTWDGNSQDGTVWKKIDEYISESSDLTFSHGYCPTCYEKEMEEIDKLKRKVTPIAPADRKD